MVKPVTIITCILSIFLCWSYANPVDPLRIFPLVSEIQIFDSTHWTAEIGLNSGTYNYNLDLKLTLPCSTDIFWIKTNPADTQPSSKRNIWINKDGIGLITHKHFPKIKIHSQFFICCSPFPGGKGGQLVNLHLKSQPHQTYVPKTIIYNSPFSFNGRETVYYYIRDNTPTLGEKNDSLNIYSVIKGVVVDQQDKPVPNSCGSFYTYSNGVPYDCLTKSDPQIYKTDSVGCFIISNYLPFPKSYIIFTDDNNKPISKAYIGMIDVQPDSTVCLKVNLDDNNQVKISNSIRPNLDLKIIKIIQNPQSQHITIFMTNSSFFTGEVSIQIFAMKGTLVRTISRKISGVGTFSVMWDKKDLSGKSVPAGNYLFSIIHGTTSIQKTVSIIN